MYLVTLKHGDGEAGIRCLAANGNGTPSDIPTKCVIYVHQSVAVAYILVCMPLCPRGYQSMYCLLDRYENKLHAYLIDTYNGHRPHPPAGNV